MKNKLTQTIAKLPFIAVYPFELFCCFIIIYTLISLANQRATDPQESLLYFLVPFAVIYFVIKLLQHRFKRAYLEILPFSYISVAYLLQFHTTLERLAGDKNLTDSVMIITLMIVIINGTDKGFDSYKRFKETKELP